MILSATRALARQAEAVEEAFAPGQRQAADPTGWVVADQHVAGFGAQAGAVAGRAGHGWRYLASSSRTAMESVSLEAPLEVGNDALRRRKPLSTGLPPSER